MRNLFVCHSELSVSVWFAEVGFIIGEPFGRYVPEGEPAEVKLLLLVSRSEWLIPWGVSLCNLLPYTNCWYVPKGRREAVGRFLICPVCVLLFFIELVEYFFRHMCGTCLFAAVRCPFPFKLQRYDSPLVNRLADTFPKENLPRWSYYRWFHTQSDVFPEECCSAISCRLPNPYLFPKEYLER